jgi:hypothetical protein
MSWLGSDPIERGEGRLNLAPTHDIYMACPALLPFQVREGKGISPRPQQVDQELIGVVLCHRGAYGDAWKVKRRLTCVKI